MLLTKFTPIEVSFSRFFISSIIFSLWVIIKKRDELILIIKNDLKILILGTILGPLSAMVLFNYAISSVPIGIAGIIFTSEAVLTYIFAICLKQEKWKTMRMISILISLFGIIIVSYSKFSGSVYMTGIFFLFLCEIIWALNTVISKQIVDKYSPIVMISANFLISSLFLIPFIDTNFWSELYHMDYTLWGALSFCVLPCTIMGFSIWYWCLKFVSPSTVAISLYLLPVFTILGGLIALDETINTTMSIGIFITFSGLYLVNFKYK